MRRSTVTTVTWRARQSQALKKNRGPMVMPTPQAKTIPGRT